MIYGYARVSIDNQGRKAQVDALKRAGALRMFTDRISGSVERRPQLRRLLSALGKGDTLLVVRIDRLAHSMADLLNVIGIIQQRGANFRSLSEPWANLDAEMGKFILGMLAGVAKLERSFLQARMADGRAKAKAMGKSLGRLPLLSPEQHDAAREMLRSGHSMRYVADYFNVGVTTIWRVAHSEQLH